MGRHVRCVAWALDPRTWTTPLVILAAFGMVFVYDPAAETIISRLRGHGGVCMTIPSLRSNKATNAALQEITCIAVHHIDPYRFLTSSRDQSTRLYDLRYIPRQQPNNPPWPPSTRPSFAGASFGLHVTGSEGDGFGRCIAVLAGGRSGGHQAAILHVVRRPFHPTKHLTYLNYLCHRPGIQPKI